MSMVDNFKVLNDLDLVYVLINYDGLFPFNIESMPLIMCEKGQRTKISEFLKLEKAEDSEIRYSSEKCGVSFMLIEKGKDYFPEQFESALIHRRALTSEIVYVPNPEDQIVADMYRLFLREDVVRMSAPSARQIRRGVLSYLSRRIGIVKPRYSEVPHNYDHQSAVLSQ